MTRVYLAGGISDTDRKLGLKRTAEKLRDIGYEIYCASENDNINDKSNDPTPMDIYYGDISEIKKADVMVVRISGGNEDGTLSEIGMVAGWNEMVSDFTSAMKLLTKSYGMDFNQIPLDLKPIRIIAYTTNERLLDPDFWNGIPSGGFNHLVAGMIDRWGLFVGNEDDMLKYMSGYKELMYNE